MSDRHWTCDGCGAEMKMTPNGSIRVREQAYKELMPQLEKAANARAARIRELEAALAKAKSYLIAVSGYVDATEILAIIETALPSVGNESTQGSSDGRARDTGPGIPGVAGSKPAPATFSDVRCTVCGGARLQKDGKLAACSFLGCKEPLRDYNAEQRASEAKGRWVCNACGNTEDKEREVSCWKCGKGEMIYTRPTSAEFDPEHCPTCREWANRHRPPDPKVEVKSELWDAAQLKMKQLGDEIQKSGASQLEKSNMLHTHSKLCMFAGDAWESFVVRPAQRTNEPLLTYGCVACATPIASSGMCERCSRAWGIGASEERERILNLPSTMNKDQIRALPLPRPDNPEHRPGGGARATLPGERPSESSVEAAKAWMFENLPGGIDRCARRMHSLAQLLDSQRSETAKAEGEKR